MYGFVEEMEGYVKELSIVKSKINVIWKSHKNHVIINKIFIFQSIGERYFNRHSPKIEIIVKQGQEHNTTKPCNRIRKIKIITKRSY